MGGRRDLGVKVVVREPQSVDVVEVEVGADGGVDLGGKSENGGGRAG